MVLSPSTPATTFATPIEQNTVELINERLDAWAVTLSSAVDYFSEVARCEQALCKTHSKLAASLAQSVSSSSSGTGSGSSSPRTDAGRSNFWLGPLQAFSLQMSSGAESLQKYAKEETLVRLEGLRDEFMQRSKSVRERLGKCQRSLGREQEGLLKVMKEHEKLWTQRLEKTATQALAQAAGSGSGPGEVPEQKDVWLSELHLHGQIESFLEEKRRFCCVLGELYSEARLLNAECSRRLAEVIAEHFTVKSKHLLAQTELMKDVTRGIEAVAPETEWQAALVRARLDYEWRLEAPPIDGFSQSVLQQISCAIYGAVQPSADGRSAPASPLARAPSSSVAARPVRIVKSGYLMRPGATFGPAWQVFFCVLTDSHHLHLFHPETKKKSRSSRSAPSPDQQAYHVPSADDQLSQRHLADLNAAIATAWLGFMGRPGARPDEWLRIDTRLLDPALSVPLFEGVAVTVESPNEHIWSIQVPGSASFFGRGDRKHQLKSFLEEDMVDWCIALKDQIAASQAAPTAFFSQKVQQQHLAHPTWTSKEAVSNEVEDQWSPTDEPFEDEEDSAEPSALSGLSGLSLGSRSLETQPKPITPATNSATTPAFNLENPWG